MIYLDTHVVVWLQAGLVDRLTQTAIALINQNDLQISPIVRLELQYLFEINRITQDPDRIVSDLASRIGLVVSSTPFNEVVTSAKSIRWTRDPFDRLLVAQAAFDKSNFLTSDRLILEHFKAARWS